uniref:ADAM metallopeptidase with thrombospondin type 1 motif 8 n=1 Tax=Meleagris gallopavo TaxID=9103 RepID=G1MRA5_MELGA
MPQPKPSLCPRSCLAEEPCTAWTSSASRSLAKTSSTAPTPRRRTSVPSCGVGPAVGSRCATPRTAACPGLMAPPAQTVGCAGMEPACHRMHCSPSRRLMAAGVHGAHGVRAHGRAVVACSSPTATAIIPGHSTAAATARASAPVTSRATPTSARRMVSSLLFPKARSPTPRAFFLHPVIALQFVGYKQHLPLCMLPLSSRLPHISAEEDERSLLAAQGFWVIVLPFLLGKSFREQQCEKYNSYNFTDLEGNRLEWVPKYAGVSPRDRCKLFCRARGRSEFKVFEPKVIDGTLCGPETLSICVHGQCIKAGCDHVVGSSKKLDKCGVCGGNGSTCRKISGSLNRSKYGYNDIVTIPAGATNIDIKQRSHRGVRHDGNYLALRTLEGRYLLNGDFAISAMEQDILLKGTILKYSGSMTTLERLQSFRQLPEPLTVQLLTIASEVFPPKVKYTFFIPKDVPFSKQKDKEKKSANVIRPMLTSQWVLGDWSECSKTCGSGWQRRTVECRDVEGQPSATCDRALKPEDIKPCGDIPCPLWRMGPWSPCSQTCGEGVRTRNASCIHYTGTVIAPEKCSSPGPPPATATCLLRQC